MLDLAELQRLIDACHAAQAPADTFDVAAIRAAEADVREIGGGYLVLPPAGAIEVVHVVPHGGTRTPARFADTFAAAEPRLLAQSIVDNCDLGTATVATRLALRPRGRAIAFFDCTRLLADANRALPEQQVPTAAYRGVPLLRADLPEAKRREIRTTLVQPWHAAIEQCITDHAHTVRRIVHHHSFDEFPGSATPHDRSRERRPAAMVFQDRLNNGGGSFLPAAELRRVVAALRAPLQHLDPTAQVEVDSTYVAPAMPIVPRTVPICVYELRKDLLRDRDAREQLFAALLDSL